MEKCKISLSQMNLILTGIEHGVRQSENGNNLQAALLSAYDLYEVEKPQSEFMNELSVKESGDWLENAGDDARAVDR